MPLKSVFKFSCLHRTGLDLTSSKTTLNTTLHVKNKTKKTKHEGKLSEKKHFPSSSDVRSPHPADDEDFYLHQSGVATFDVHGWMRIRTPVIKGEEKYSVASTKPLRISIPAVLSYLTSG